MADTKDEENLNTPTDNQSENPLNEITPINYTETINSNQETKNMEVHHHAHDPAAPHHKKNWKSYFWEFLMLFLAVFCGFFAEYQLEHKIENERGREYVLSMINDLKADTTYLEKNIKIFENYLKLQKIALSSFDKLEKGYDDKAFQDMNAGFNGFPDFIYSDATIQQLKNSGGFRLIKNHKIIDSIMRYDSEVRVILIQETYLGQKYFDIVNYQNEVINYKELFKQRRQLKKTSSQLEAEKFDLFLTHDKMAVAKLYNNLSYYSSIFITSLKQEKQLKKSAIKLILFLQKEYDLEYK